MLNLENVVMLRGGPKMTSVTKCNCVSNVDLSDALMHAERGKVGKQELKSNEWAEVQLVHTYYGEKVQRLGNLN